MSDEFNMEELEQKLRTVLKNAPEFQKFLAGVNFDASKMGAEAYHYKLTLLDNPFTDLTQENEQWEMGWLCEETAQTEEFDDGL